MWLCLRGLEEAKNRAGPAGADGALLAATHALSALLGSFLGELPPNTLLAVIGTGGVARGAAPRVCSDGSTRPPGCVCMAVADPAAPSAAPAAPAAAPPWSAEAQADS